MADESDRQRRLARAIREALDAAKVKPAELGGLLGVSEKTVYRWLSGESVPDALTVRPLADALGVSPMMLVDPPPVPEYPLADYLVRKATAEGLEEGLKPRPSPRRLRVAEPSDE